MFSGTVLYSSKELIEEKIAKLIEMLNTKKVSRIVWNTDPNTETISITVDIRENDL